MVFISNFVKINGTKYLPLSENFDPFNAETGLGKTKIELEQIGFLFDKTYMDVINSEYEFKLNNPAPSNTSVVKRYFNPFIKDYFFEYEEVPTDMQKELADLKAQNAQMLLALVKGGLM